MIDALLYGLRLWWARHKGGRKAAEQHGKEQHDIPEGKIRQSGRP